MMTGHRPARTLIVDDEPLARRRLRTLLADEPDIEIVGEAANGNAAVTSGGNEDAGNFALGLAADIYSKYRIDLKYTGYFGNYSTNPATGTAAVFNGVNASLSDRGWWSLTFKTTF